MPDTTQVSKFTYNPGSRRYTERSSGRYVAAQTVRSAVDTVISAETLRIRSVAQELVNGSINISEWMIQTQAIIKDLHVSMGLAANGGLANTGAKELGFIASEVKKQYQYLRSFAKQIKNGSHALNGSLVSRAALYTQAARGTYEDVIRKNAEGSSDTQERRMLGSSDHCSTCLEQSALGWQPIGTLNRIGDSLCLSNCHCEFQFK
jgi:phage antirepressor YoqD-like protein